MRFRFLTVIERVGNRLPDPATLFVIGCGLVLVFSALAAQLDWTVTHPVSGKLEHARSLLTVDGVRWIFLSAIDNFVRFPPLGIVLVAMLGIGVADKTGLLGALLKLIVLAVPPKLLTPTVVFAGVMSSVAADAGYVVLPPLAAAVFARAGRAPLAGFAAVTFGIAGGFSANLLLTSLDPLLQGITLQAARLVDPSAVVRVDCNWFFMMASTFMLTLLGWAINGLVIERRFNATDVAEQISNGAIEASGPERPDAKERRGLIAAGVTALLVTAALVMLIAIDGAPLHGEHEIAPGRVEPIWSAVLVPILFVWFLLPGLAYGIAVGNVRNDRDAARSMNETMSMMGSYLVLAFFAGQFVSWLGHSNLALMFAIEAAGWLKPLAGSHHVLLPAIVLLAVGADFLVVSASAKWLALAPILVPLGMQLGIPPEMTQAAYRVGDSVVNPISPLNFYLPILLLTMRRYAPASGLGTYFALVMPYSIAALFVWTAFLLLWVQLGIPLGP